MEVVRKYGFLAISLIYFIGVTTSLAFQKSPPTDAVAFHAVNGYVNLITHDFRMSPATPPLMREFVALPWLFLKPQLDLADASWQQAESVDFGLKFMYADNRAIAWDLLRSSVFMMIGLSLGVLAMSYHAANRMYGPKAAQIAVILLAFSPPFIAYASSINTDMGILLGYLLTIYYLFEYWEIKKGRGFPFKLAFAFMVGLASKFTAILLILPMAVLSLWRGGIKKSLFVLMGVTLLAFAGVWATYFFEFKPLLKNVPRAEQKVEYIQQILNAISVQNPTIRERVIRAAHEQPIPLSSWILGFAGIVRSHHDVYRHYFWGKWREDQVPYHYLVSFFTKITMGMIILIFIRLLATVIGKIAWSIKDAYLLLPTLILFIMTFRDSTGVGMRYLVPLVPLITMWISAIWAKQLPRALQLCAKVALGAHILASIMAYPYYFAYFNEMIGGPKNAYKFFRANDLEWGMELVELGKYVQTNNLNPVKEGLFGSYDYSFYGIQTIPLQNEDYLIPQPRVYAISVFELDHFIWTYDYEPAHIIGHVIWIYDFRDQEKAPSIDSHEKY